MSGNQSEGKKDLLIPGSIIVAAVIVAVALIYSTGSKVVRPLDAVGQNPVGAVNDNSADLVDDDVILGDVNAPVTIVEFGDYQCPFCKKMFDETEQQLRDNYISTGKARMVYRDFPLTGIHESAQAAAEASQCAAEQDKFWAYHDLLFSRQSQLGTADYVAWAGELGLDTVKFRSCYQSHKYADEVAKDYNDGIKLGVNGTPATFVNGKLLIGAQPYSVFKQEIEAALRKAK